MHSNTLEIEKIDKSSVEKTQKILFKTHDGHYIESVSMVEKDDAQSVYHLKLVVMWIVILCNCIHGSYTQSGDWRNY